MADALIITAPAAMSAPLPNTPILALRGDVVVRASDGFSGAAVSLGGRAVDAAAGGPQVSWQVDGPSDCWVTTGNGRLSYGPATGGTFCVYIPSGESAANREVEVSVRVLEVPSANTHLDLFRDVVGATASRKMRLSLSNTGSITFSYSAPSASGEAETVGSGFTYGAGDVLAVRYNTKTGAYRIRKNGATVREGTYIPAAPRTLTGTIFGIAGSNGMSAGVLDDFKITETII